jgi:uncharacterized phage-associated protein
MKNKAVAEYFIKLANYHGESITHLKLQKLVYYAQVWHIALNDRTPLFEENREFQAWQHGPVNYDLYKDYKKYLYNQINHEPNEELINKYLSEDDKEFIEEVSSVYLQYGAYKLELMTHQEEPWIKARGGLPNDAPSKTVIDESVMYDFYKKLSESENK